MNTKLQIPESITKLLGSTIVEDIILGVLWCKNNLGKKWCEENFTHMRITPKGGQENYPIPKSVTIDTGEMIISFGKWGVLIGTVCLQMLPDIVNKYASQTIIYSE